MYGLGSLMQSLNDQTKNVWVAPQIGMLNVLKPDIKSCMFYIYSRLKESLLTELHIALCKCLVIWLRRKIFVN